MKAERFWRFNKQDKIEIDERGLVKFLEQLGYASYYTMSNKTSEPVYVFRSGYIVESIIPSRIHTDTIRALASGIIDEDILPPATRNDVLSKLMGSKMILKKEVTLALTELDKPMKSDTKDSAYFFYRNNAVKVTRDIIQLLPTDQLDFYVWKSQIIDRDFELIDLETIIAKSEYYKFLMNVSMRPVNGKLEYDPERMNNLFRLQGYLLHDYKDRANPRAVVLMDVSDKGEPSGRTGKGLIIDGISQLKKTIKEDGKSFKDDNRFKFSLVTIDSKVVYLDDVPEKFNFENFFSVISEGISVELKFVNKFYIPYDFSPKIAISTNYAITGRGSSNEARKYEYELSNFYSEKHTPSDDFGHLLFYAWDSYQWNMFDYLMMYSVQEYLDKGVASSVCINDKYNKLLAETGKQFTDWITTFDLNYKFRYEKAVLYRDYVNHCEGCPDVNRLMFCKRLQVYAKIYGIKTTESHSGYERYIEFAVV